MEGRRTLAISIHMEIDEKSREGNKEEIKAKMALVDWQR
jgi:hypothetical protein